MEDKDHQKSKRVTKRKTTMMIISKDEDHQKSKRITRNKSTMMTNSMPQKTSNESKEKSKQSEIIGKQEKSTRKRKRKDSKTQVHFSTSLSKLLEESERETYEHVQESIKSPAKSSQISTKHDDSSLENICDPCTSGKTQKGPTVFDSLHESPVCGRNSKKNSVQQDDLMSTSTLMKRDRSEEMDVAKPDRDSNIKTSPSAEEAAKKFWLDYWSNLISDDEFTRFHNFMMNDATPAVIGLCTLTLLHLQEYVLSFLRDCYEHMSGHIVEVKSEVESAEDDSKKKAKNAKNEKSSNKRRRINKKNPKKQIKRESTKQ